MAFDYSKVVDITTIPSTVGILFTNPSARKTYIRMINIHNGNSSSETVKIYLVPDSGGSVGTPSALNCIYEESIPAYGTRIIEFQNPGLMLVDENETFQAVTTTPNIVTILATGGQE